MQKVGRGPSWQLYGVVASVLIGMVGTFRGFLMGPSFPRVNHGASVPSAQYKCYASLPSKRLGSLDCGRYVHAVHLQRLNTLPGEPLLLLFLLHVEGYRRHLAAQGAVISLLHLHLSQFQAQGRMKNVCLPLYGVLMTDIRSVCLVCACRYSGVRARCRETRPPRAMMTLCSWRSCSSLPQNTSSAIVARSCISVENASFILVSALCYPCSHIILDISRFTVLPAECALCPHSDTRGPGKGGLQRTSYQFSV